ncbi:EF-hand domain-containing protein D1 [Suricata suricatta]|uniref:EF-hand domain-containing protein D1 n=1 Tax=Suricata suricatta TaxID=37032 RepID=UPI001155C4C8|nr:EF-hand domain-containing protein D1 [Suricata suricatta]
MSETLPPPPAGASHRQTSRPPGATAILGGAWCHLWALGSSHPRPVLGREPRQSGYFCGTRKEPPNGRETFPLPSPRGPQGPLSPSERARAARSELIGASTPCPGERPASWPEPRGGGSGRAALEAKTPAASGGRSPSPGASSKAAAPPRPPSSPARGSTQPPGSGARAERRLAPEPEVPAPAPTACADAELSAQLNRRLGINEGTARPRRCKVFNPYTDFPEFSRRLIRDLESMFRKYDAGRDGFIDLMELKLMMEKLGAPQTHLGLKRMIKEVDEDFDGRLSFREFLLIFHKAAAGELQEDSGLMALAKLSEIDVAQEGVKGAKDFFEAKVQALSCASKFEAELKAEQDERKQEEEKRRLRQAAFQELKAAFST